MNIYGWVRKTGGVSHYRIQEKLRGMALLGHTVACGPELNFGRVAEYDMVITSVHGEAEASAGWEAMARLPGRPFMVYDIDDDVWNFRQGLHQYEYWQDETLLRNVQSCIACADLITTPSPVLADIVAGLNPRVQVIYNYVPAWVTSIQPCRVNEFTVGYQGGDTHKYDVALIAPQVFRFLAAKPRSRLAVWGSSEYDGPFKSRVTLTPWERNIAQYYLSLRMSVGLAPLEATAFNDAKSAIKAVEYAALGIPCIASDRVTYRGTVFDGATGRLIDDDSWYDVLYELSENPLIVTAWGQSARAKARLHWTTEANASDYETMIRRAMRG